MTKLICCASHAWWFHNHIIDDTCKVDFVNTPYKLHIVKQVMSGRWFAINNNMKSCGIVWNTIADISEIQTARSKKRNCNKKANAQFWKISLLTPLQKGL